MNWLIFIFCFVTASSAFSLPPSKNTEHNTYEAVTGESADEERLFWDSFYKQKDFAYGKDAVGFLKEHIEKIPKGKAFVPAMGEGRNAVYLAKQGFEVIGNDISDVAVDRALVLAKKAGVTIKASVVDLKQYKFAENQFDFIFICLYIDRSLIADFKKSLKKGGYIMFYQDVYEGDPKKSPTLFWVRHNELPELLKDFKMVAYKEFNDHGRKVAAALAKKI